QDRQPGPAELPGVPHQQADARAQRGQREDLADDPHGQERAGRAARVTAGAGPRGPFAGTDRAGSAAITGPLFFRSGIFARATWSSGLADANRWANSIPEGNDECIIAWPWPLQRPSV